jgi:hypothetical protein
MDTIYDYIHQVSAVFIFCFALGILIIGSRNLDKWILTVKGEIQNTNIIYEDNQVERQESDITYSYLVAYLLNDIESDVIIDGLVLKREEFNPLNFDYNIIPKSFYSKTYQYNSNGSIATIIFKKIG